MSAKKRVVLFLVEGRSEKNALETSIAEIYDNIDERYEIVFRCLQTDSDGNDKPDAGGDITAMYGVEPSNMEKCINDFFFLSDAIYPFREDDILEIIQIVDTDGAFVSDDAIVQKEVETTRYEEECIETKHKDKIVERNYNKQLNLEHLIDRKEIKIYDLNATVKYSVYYMSCNLDHILYGERNLDHRLKCKKAEEFSSKCDYDINVFLNILNENGFEGTYEESWEYIKNHSLDKCTNLNILIDQLEELI